MGRGYHRAEKGEKKKKKKKKKKIRPLSWGQGWLRPLRSFTASGEEMIMQVLRRSLRFRCSSSKKEANLEKSDQSATELPAASLFHL